MIKVKALYKTKYTKSKGKETIFTTLLVEGHASADNDNGIKCCAGISAILYGFSKIVSGAYDNVKIDKGLFYYNFHNKNLTEMDTLYGLNLVVVQLYEIYKTYPQFFKSFDLIEKERGI